MDFVGQETPTESKFPTVFLTNSESGSIECYSLIVYRSLNATLCLFVESVNMQNIELLELQTFLDSELGRIASKIGDNVSVSRPLFSDIPFHYVYYNPDSLSLKTSFSDPQNPSTPMPPATIYKLVCETFDHFVETEVENFSQVEVKADDDWWIVVKKVNGRVLTLFIPSTASTCIVDVHDVVEQIVKAYFLNLFVVWWRLRY